MRPSKPGGTWGGTWRLAPFLPASQRPLAEGSMVKRGHFGPAGWLAMPSDQKLSQAMWIQLIKKQEYIYIYIFIYLFIDLFIMSPCLSTVSQSSAKCRGWPVGHSNPQLPGDILVDHSNPGDFWIQKTSPGPHRRMILVIRFHDSK